MRQLKLVKNKQFFSSSHWARFWTKFFLFPLWVILSITCATLLCPKKYTRFIFASITALWKSSECLCVYSIDCVFLVTGRLWSLESGPPGFRSWLCYLVDVVLWQFLNTSVSFSSLFCVDGYNIKCFIGPKGLAQFWHIVSAQEIFPLSLPFKQFNLDDHKWLLLILRNPRCLVIAQYWSLQLCPFTANLASGTTVLNP